MAVTQVQTASGFAAAASTTFAATFSTPVTAGNLIIYVVGGDKNIGTLTLSGYTKTVDTRSTDNSVSLVIAWTTAAGGETTISGTISGANTGGSEIRVYEWSESGAGAWEVKGSAVNTSTGTTVTTLSSGTTGSVISAGQAIAAFAADSVATEGTVSYSNSFTASASTPTSGAGNAGLWAAQKAIASGTAETTITRTGGTADQHNGGIIVFGRAVVTTIAPGGVASTEAFGTAVVSQAILATGPGSSEAFGTAVVSQQIQGTAIAGAEAFGTTVVASAGYSLFPVSIGSAEAFSEPVVEVSTLAAFVGSLVVEAIYVGQLQVSTLYVGALLAG